MSTPNLSTASGRIWLSNRDPGNDENEIVEIGNFWLNQSTGALFYCTNQTRQSNGWRQITSTSLE